MSDKKSINLPEVVSVRNLSELLEVTPSEIIKKLISSGVMATINESIDFDTAAIIADEFGFDVVKEEQKSEEQSDEEDDSGKDTELKNRPPVVTIMGHVDHGKTKLLDAIRQTNVIETESGGITQHIGAYQTAVEIEEGKKKIKRVITFLDTPGHEAFSAMRAHGANITDIVILVVAADEGVKPQTVEAISHARAAKVPIIVAINKADKPESDLERVKRELSEHKLIPEEWGGQTPMMAVSAKTGMNIKELLELVVLTADVEGIKASYEKNAKGMIIESKMQSGKGPIATVVIQEGTLRPGDTIVYQDHYSKVRFIEDWKGKRIKEAYPSDPILIAGFKSVPKVGMFIKQVKDEKTAKLITESLSKQNSIRSIAKSISLSEISKEAKEGSLKELNLIIKTDVKGSLDAIKSTLMDIDAQDIKVNIISDGVGAVTESDVNLALASHAVILAFRSPVPPAVLKHAESNKVKISKYDIIYQLIDDILAALEGMLEPEIIETVTGKLEILKVFRTEKDRGIVGGKVISGYISPGSKIKVYRDEEVLGELKTESVQLGGEKVSQIAKGNECGVSYIGSLKLKQSDTLEFILVEEKLKKIKKKV